MMGPGVPQTVQPRLVRTSGHYEGVDYVIACANCETPYSVINARYPLYFMTCAYSIRTMVKIDSVQKFRTVPCSFVCDACRVEHGLPVCQNGFTEIPRG